MTFLAVAGEKKAIQRAICAAQADSVAAAEGRHPAFCLPLNILILTDGPSRGSTA